jgi:hypothetical protein
MSTEYGFLFSFYMRQLPTKTQIRIEVIVQNVHLESHLQFTKKLFSILLLFITLSKEQIISTI